MRLKVRGSQPLTALYSAAFAPTRAHRSPVVYYRTKPNTSAFAIFHETICEGLVPAWWDERGFPVTYPTEHEAQREIADMVITQLQQFLAGERDFDDAIVCDDFVLPVEVWPDGTIQLADGRSFGCRS